MDAYALKSIKMVLARRPPCSRSLSQQTHTSTCAQIQSPHSVLKCYEQKPTHAHTDTRKKVGSFTNISLSISSCSHFSLEEDSIPAGGFFFVYCEQTKVLSAANHCEANMLGAAAGNQGFHDQLSPVQLATLSWFLKPEQHLLCVSCLFWVFCDVILHLLVILSN